MPAWNPTQYLAFERPRLQPGLDLIARVAGRAPRRVVDLGCGTGHLTRMLKERFPEAEVEGIDNSPAMLAKASSSFPELRWREQDIAAWTAAAPVDLIYTNAALQWLPDHAGLFPRLLAQLAPGGTFACQMPRNFDAPSHVLLRETAADGPWAARLAPKLRAEPVAAPEVYYDLLAGRTTALDIWETEYLQVLEGKDPVLEWTKGTALLPVLETLGGEELDRFLAAYRDRLAAAYPRRADGKVLFPFRRLFIVAEV